MKCFKIFGGAKAPNAPLLAPLIVAFRVFSSCIPTWSADGL